MVFLLAGPATNLVTISAVIQTLGRRAALLYSICIGVLSLAFGLLLDAIYSAFSIAPTAGAGGFHEHADSNWIGSASAIILVVLTAMHLAAKLRQIAAK